MARTRVFRRARHIGAGIGLAGIAGMLWTAAAHADAGDALVAATTNADDPAVFYYSADPTNVFSPVYTISPTGAEDVISTDASGVVGTQDFTVSYFGIPLDTFTGGVTYAPVSSPLDLFGSPYVEDISTLGASGTLIPNGTGFLVEELGGGYGNVLEEANITGTSPVIGDFLTTPFGPENVTPFVNEFLNFAGSITGTPSPLSAAADGAVSGAATPDDVIGQAIADLNQGVAVLDAAPTADLSARQAETLANSINLDTELDSPLAQMATLQDGFSAADQTYLAGADEQLVTAAANILSADQAFVAADQAGELSGSGFNSADLTLIESAFGFLGADLNVGGAELFAIFTGGLDPSSAADLASSIDPVTAVDPSIYADLLSSIGL